MVIHRIHGDLKSEVTFLIAYIFTLSTSFCSISDSWKSVKLASLFIFVSVTSLWHFVTLISWYLYWWCSWMVTFTRWSH